MRITDAHQHFWTTESIVELGLPPEYSLLARDFEPAELKPQMDEVGVQQTVLVQVNFSLKNTYDFLEIARANDWVGGVVGWVDLVDPKVGDTLDDLQTYPKLKGVRHQWEMEPDPAWILRDDVLRGLREVAKRGFTFDLVAKPYNWQYISQVAEAVPDLPLVIDHIAKPQIRVKQFDDWATAMTRWAQIPRMMIKVSGMITEADWRHWKPADLKPYVEKAIELFGVDRVMYGSDWPVCTVAGSYAQVFEALLKCLASLTEAEKAKVLGENARGFYGLD